MPPDDRAGTDVSLRRMTPWTRGLPATVPRHRDGRSRDRRVGVAADARRATPASTGSTDLFASVRRAGLLKANRAGTPAGPATTSRRSRLVACGANVRGQGREAASSSTDSPSHPAVSLTTLRPVAAIHGGASGANHLVRRGSTDQQCEAARGYGTVLGGTFWLVESTHLSCVGVHRFVAARPRSRSRCGGSRCPYRADPDERVGIAADSDRPGHPAGGLDDRER